MYARSRLNAGGKVKPRGRDLSRHRCRNNMVLLALQLVERASHLFLTEYHDCRTSSRAPRRGPDLSSPPEEHSPTGIDLETRMQ